MDYNLAQILFNDPFEIVNIFFENRVWVLLSEFFKTFYVTLMLYFWLSVFDKILIENLSEGFFSNHAEKFKLFIIIALFLSIFSFNSYTLYMQYEDKYEELHREKQALALCEGTILVFQLIYLVYFIILAIVYIKMSLKGIILANTSSNLLYISSILVFIITTVNAIQDTQEIDQQTTLGYLAFHGLLSCYTIMLAYLYMPVQGAQGQEIEFEMKKEQDQIFREVYGEDDAVDEETKKPEHSKKDHKEHEKKKRVWEKIQKSMESEEDEGKKKTDLDENDDEYIYI